MDLILWRHAEADSTVPDQDRKLTPKGQRQAKNAAKWLERNLPKGYRLLASPARRAQQTAQALGGRIETRRELDVGADAKAILAAAGWPSDEERAVVLVGHQPGFGEAAMLALTGKASAFSIRKGAFVWLSRREREDGARALLRAALSPDLL